MDDISAWKGSTTRVGRRVVADWTMLPHPSITFSLNLGTTYSYDDACHATSMPEVSIRCIDDRIHVLRSDVTLHKLKTLPRFVFDLPDNSAHLTSAAIVAFPQNIVNARSAMLIQWKIAQ